MILIILSLIDIAVGVSLMFPNFLGFYLGIIILLKGISSIIGSFVSGFYFEIMGAIDLISGLMLIFGFFVPWFWIIPMLKGIYSLIVGMGSK